MLLKHTHRKLYLGKNSFFEEAKELSKVLKSLGISLKKANKWKVSPNIQFNSKLFEFDFEDILEKLSKAPSKFTCKTIKNYHAKTSCNVSNDF